MLSNLSEQKNLEIVVSNLKQFAMHALQKYTDVATDDVHALQRVVMIYAGLTINISMNTFQLPVRKIATSLAD